MAKAQTKTTAAPKAKATGKAIKKTAGLAASKRMRKANLQVVPEKLYSLDEALKILKAAPQTKFDQTLEVAINLGVDVKQSDQNVRGVVAMPNGLGKTVRVAVFARDAKAEEAKKAGAEIVGAEDLVEKIKGGFLDFDRCIATPDMMAMVGQVAKVLGPRGLMPNPKTGTVSPNVADAIKNVKAGQVEFKTEKNGIVQAGVGKISFNDAALKENLKALFQALQKAKPESVKGVFIKRIALSTTMGPGVRLNVSEANAA